MSGIISIPRTPSLSLKTPTSWPISSLSSFTLGSHVYQKRAALVIILLMAKAVNLVAKAVNPSISAIQSPSMPSPTRTSLFTNGLCGVGMNLVVMITWIFPPIPPTPSQLMKVSLTMEDKANSGLLPILSKA